MGRLQSIMSTIRGYKYTKYFVTLFFIVLIVGFLDENSFMNREKRIKEIKQLQYEISVLKNQYDNDTRKLKELDEYETVERFARERYLMKRANEDLFVVVSE